MQKIVDLFNPCLKVKYPLPKINNLYVVCRLYTVKHKLLKTKTKYLSFENYRLLACFLFQGLLMLLGARPSKSHDSLLFELQTTFVVTQSS